MCIANVSMMIYFIGVASGRVCECVRYRRRRRGWGGWGVGGWWEDEGCKQPPMPCEMGWPGAQTQKHNKSEREINFACSRKEQTASQSLRFSWHLPYIAKRRIIRHRCRSQYPSLFGAVKIHFPFFISAQSHFNLFARTARRLWDIHRHRFWKQTVVSPTMKYIRCVWRLRV